MMSRREKVLIVDDEEHVIFVLHRALHARNDKLDVFAASSGEIAQQILDEYPIDVLVTDVRLPGIDGLELLSWAAVRSPRTRAIVMTSYDLLTYKERALRFGCVRFVQKPFEMREMTQLILSALGERTSLSGSLADLSVADVVQMLCLSGKTTAVRVVDGEHLGLALIRSGEIVHALWDDLSGEEAFFQMLRASRGEFTTHAFPEQAPTTVARGWQQLLLEGMQRIDEEQLVLGQARLTPTSFTPPAASEQGEAERLIDEGFKLVRDGQLLEARACWEGASRLDPDNRTIRLNLRRLDQLEARQQR